MGGSITLSTGVSEVPGLGSRRAEALRGLGLTNVGRLIAHLPVRHERQEAEGQIGGLAPGAVVSARGEVTATRVVGHGRRPRFEAVLVDPSGRLDLVWFHALYLREKVRPGMRLRVQGKAQAHGPGLRIANPAFEVLGAEGAEPESRAARLRPVYPAGGAVTSRDIERAIGAVLGPALALVEDHLGEAYRRARELPELREAYRMMHAPADEGEVVSARRRLAYDELLLLQLGVHLKRAHLRRTMVAPVLRWSPGLDEHIRRLLPFELTEGQRAAVAEVARDLASGSATNRLIQGDVGSGKTVVAVYAMLMAVASGHQAALMAPTEVLAEQHAASVGKLLAGSRVRTALLTGALGEEERGGVLAGLESGGVDLLVGTHALLTERVRFKSLAVAVIDEQHRFGVGQRAVLRSKGERVEGREVTPHVLVMTATPIPRTLALTLFGDLDVSVIRGMPMGRRAVTTRVVGSEGRGEAYEAVRAAAGRGEQAFVVAPAIEGDDSAGVRELARSLGEVELRGLRLGVLHGRLKRVTRERVMERFRSGAIDVLVATTVIEVGVDVPNASVMVIEDAERFGLAQLHQLRGRVGRGTSGGSCWLVGRATTEEARQRLEVIERSHDGFELAEKDLEIRGPGQVFGLRQSGMPDFRVADLARDVELLAMARRDAAAWIERSPTLGAPDEALVRRRLLKAHGPWLGLGDVG